MTIKTTSARQTQDFGKEFAKNLRDGGIVALYGDLGAGKTTLVQGIAKGLGIKRRLISPTFVLIRGYIPATSHELKTTQRLFHIDLYRLNEAKEALGLGIKELWENPTNILLIEWPEKIKKLLPRTRWNVKLETLGENVRQITYEALH